MPEITVHQRDNLDFLKGEPDEKYDVIYIDPPFNTGDRQVSARDKTVSYDDSLERAKFEVFLKERLIEAHRILKKSGSIYVHLDHHSVFDIKLVMDWVFGKDNFLNHIVWAYDYGGRGKDRWPRKHDDILFYAKSVGDHVFNWEDIDRIPYMAPGLQKDPERAAKGKVPTDVWWMSIVGTNSSERTGYPTQKPVKLVERALRASCPKGGLVLDFFAGSGTTGEAAFAVGAEAVLVDSNPQAIEAMKKRFGTPHEIEALHDAWVDVEYHLNT